MGRVQCRIFVSRWFQRFARSEGLSAQSLAEAVARAERGLIDADLGGDVIKQRIARPGQGKSAGYRTIIIFRRGDRAFFMYGFPKNKRANIDAEEARQFKQAAKHVLALSEDQLGELILNGDFTEVKTL